MECTRHSSCRPWIRTNRTEKRRLTLNGDNGKSLKRTVSISKLNSVGSPGSSRDVSSILVSRPFDIEMTKKLRAATTRLDLVSICRVAAKIYILRPYYIFLCLQKRAISLEHELDPRSHETRTNLVRNTEPSIRNQGDPKCIIG